jgi:raffinose/stachyose/melibiose transport system substrate-binding protein
MKRTTILSVIVLCVAAGPLFAGGQGEAGDAINLEMSHWGSQREEPYEEIFAMYQETHPNVSIEQRVVPSDNYYNVLNTSIQAGDAPDLLYTHGNKNVQLKRLVENGSVVDLTDELDTTGYPEILISKTIVDGRMYSSPGAFFDVCPVYYNSAIFEEYGLSEPETYNELLDVAETLTENDVIPFALSGKSAWDAFWILDVMVTSMASDWVNEFIQGEATFSDPRYVEVHEALMNDIVEQGYVDPNYKSVDGAGARLLFTQGNAAMIVDGSWQARAMQSNPDFETKTFHWPSREGGNVMLGSQETGFSIYSGSEYQAEAIEFLQFLMSKDSLQVLADLGLNVPGVEGVVSSDPLIRDMTNYDRVVDQFWNYITFFSRDGYDAPNDFISHQQQVLFGEMTPAEMASLMDSKMEY